MSMSTLQLDTVKGGANLARFLLQEVKPRVDMFNVDYDAQGGVKDTLTQQDLDENASLSGLTKAELDDGMYVITALLKPLLGDNFSQLQKLASRGTVNNTFQPF